MFRIIFNLSTTFLGLLLLVTAFADSWYDVFGILMCMMLIGTEIEEPK